jgi:hypothetical protein
MSATRPPGVYFETVVSPVSEALPRMDIAAFVGFAPSGPLDVPVAVEDAGRFAEIFGQDQPLAWDMEQGEMANAQLPPAVRSFFRNGGARCWVVRVADNSQAVANQYLVPGMLQTVPGSRCGGGWLEARSEGSWSDDLMVNATLGFGPIEVQPPQQADGKISLLSYPNSTTDVAPGDLLQISFDQTAASPAVAAPILFLPADSVSYATVTTGTGALQKVALISAQTGYWFRPASAADFSSTPPGSPPAQAVAGVQWLPAPLAVSWLNQPQEVDLGIGGWGIETENGQDQFLFEAPRSPAGGIVPGSWLRVTLAPNALPAGAKDLLVLVDSLRGSPILPGAVTSPAGDDETLQIVATSAWWTLDDQVAWTGDLSAPRADVVTLELWVRDGTGQVSTLDNLGLTPAHPLYLGYLPTDAQLYTQPSTPAPPPGIDLWDEVDHPRFALAAPVEPATSDLPPLPVYLPLGVPGIVDTDFYQPAVEQSGTALERDGLALAGGQLTASLFLDPDLAGATAQTLLTRAFHKQYQLQRGDGPPGEPLVKMHAVLPITEVSMLALPDAMHAGWQQVLQTQATVSAPTLVKASAADASGKVALSWTPVDGATSYSLQQSTDPLFNTWTLAWQGPGQTDPSAPSLVRSGPVPPGTTGCLSQTYFRVAAVQGLVSGPWSNTLPFVARDEIFQRCAPTTLAAPVLGVPTASRGRVMLAWTVPPAPVDGFVLQLAYEPAFALPATIYQGADPTFELWSDPSRTAYFRVSATSRGVSGPWSNTAVAASEQAYARYVMNVPPVPGATSTIAESELLKIHRAMIRLCAARGDVFAFLGLPRSYDAGTCVLYRSQLTSLLSPENGGTALSYAAVYYPWLMVRDSAADQPGAVRLVSPEGSVVGSTAAMTIASGAWYAANQALSGVVDLYPALEDDAPLLFFNNQLNLAVQDARGFLPMSSFTLSTDSQLTEINVRRLLILLRRLALQAGEDYVFHPNDTSFWRIVRRRFEELLGGLFQQGAFAGSTADESFRVRTDASVNPPESVALGRFIVELSVAPSLPLEFLTVRLLQTGGDLMFSEV